MLAASVLAIMHRAGPVSGQSDATPLEPTPWERTWQRGPLAISLRISDQAPYVADGADVKLEVTAPQGFELRLGRIDALPLPEHVRVTGQRILGPIAAADSQHSWGMEFHIDVLQAGRVELPELELEYRESPEAEWTRTATEGVSIEFRSLLGNDPDRAQPHPNPGPAPWPGRLAPGWAAALLAASLMALGGVCLWRYRPRRVPRAPQVSAYHKAMAGLEQIERAGWIEQGRLDRFYTALSGLVRHYVEDRFGLHAPEQTTEEFLQALSQRPVLSAQQSLALGSFLEQSDLVKFARHCPSVAEGRDALRAARGFIEATRDDSVLVMERQAEPSSQPSATQPSAVS
jgi:hypothetical protein